MSDVDDLADVTQEQIDWLLTKRLKLTYKIIILSTPLREDNWLKKYLTKKKDETLSSDTSS